MEDNYEKKYQEFVQETEQLKDAGFEPIVPSDAKASDNAMKAMQRIMGSVHVGNIPIYDGSYVGQSVEQEQQRPVLSNRADGMRHGGLMGTDAHMLEYSQNTKIDVPENMGTPNKGYVPWGVHDDLPSDIFHHAFSLPYTAQGIDYLAKTATAMGVRLMYRTTVYNNGYVVDKLVPFEFAGNWIKGRQMDILRKLSESTTEETVAEPSVEVYGTVATAAVNPYKKRLMKAYEEELDKLDADYKTWENTLGQWLEFERANDIEGNFQQCMLDDMLMGIYFPTITLNKGRSQKWEAKIVNIGHFDVSCCRIEEPDEDWVSRYVYFNPRWGEKNITCNNTAEAVEDELTTAFHMAQTERRLHDVMEYVGKNQRTKIPSRECTWVCTNRIYTPTKSVYPQMPWWSIFTSQTYQYAATLMYDRRVAKQNSTMWHKLLFINVSYLERYYEQMGIIGDEDAQQAVKDGIYRKVEEFMRRRDNNGKMMVMESYMSADEKNMIDSVRIVDVPQPSLKDGDDALKVATSAVFFALGIHPALIGAEPGGSSSGGTFQRELHLLKVTQLSTNQRRYTNWLNSIARFNGWDDHAVFVVKQATLTTLDNSKTGIVEEAKE